MSSEKNAPDFFIIGAQKAGTSWLWKMLKQHPGTSLPAKKEIHYFGSAELYAKGDNWYYDHFSDLNPDKVIGEASTSYFYDRVPYWYNSSRQIEFDKSLPLLPKLIDREIPNAKYIVILRDPVHRAISAYFHNMREGALSPSLGLKRVATESPKRRILEYGLYAKYLKVWMQQIPADRFRVILFEEQIKENWEKMLYEIYEFLGLDPDFKPQRPDKPVHKSWGWSRIVFNYYADKVFKNIGKSRAARFFDHFDVLPNNAIKTEDIEFLRSHYFPEKNDISSFIGSELTCWDYGEKLFL